MLEKLATLVRHLADRIRAALLAIPVGVEAALLVAIRIFGLLLLLPLILILLLLALDMLLVLRITIGHDRLHVR